MQIPWANLTSEAVKISIDELFVLATPTEQQPYSAEFQHGVAEAAKTAGLSAANEMLQARGLNCTAARLSCAHRLCWLDCVIRSSTRHRTPQ